MNAIAKAHPGAAPVGFVIETVARRMGTTPEIILGDCRQKSVVRARHMAVHLALNVTGASMAELARLFRRSDHNTIIHAVKANTSRLERDTTIARLFATLEADLRSNLHSPVHVNVAFDDVLGGVEERSRRTLQAAIEAHRERVSLIQAARDNLRVLAGRDAERLLRALASLTIAVLLCLAMPAAQAGEAGPACMPRAAAIKGLQQHYGETVAGRGLSPDGLMVEVLTAPSGTWSIVATWPHGLACMMASGDAWETAPAPKHEPETRL